MATTETAPAPTSAPTSETKITLHWLEKSRSQRILWLLEELNVPYELKTYKRGKDMLAGPDLKKVHPLGKSPVISVKTANEPEIVLSESAFIVEYLSQHYGTSMIPQQYTAGNEGKIGGETESWLRYRTLMHYAEGSLMTFLVLALVTEGIANAPVPFFVKPVTKRVASGVHDQFLTQNFVTHFGFLEDQLKSSGGDFFCGKELTGADIMLIYPLEASMGRGIWDEAKYPNLKAFVERIHKRPAFERAVQKIIDTTGEYNPNI